MTIAIIIFFIGAFIALGVLAVAIFFIRQSAKKKKEGRNFVGSGNHSGIHSSNDTDNFNDYENYQPIYFSSNDAKEDEKITAAAGAYGVSELNNLTNESSSNYSETREGSGSVTDNSSYTESSYSDSSSTSYDSSSSYSDSSSSYDSSSSDSSSSSSSD